MLYPIAILDLPTMQGMNAVNPGSAVATTFTLQPGSGWSMAMMQLAPTQDYSLRAWISALPGGQFLPTRMSYWHLNRKNAPVVVVYDLAITPDSLETGYAVPLLPGVYVLNILNLVNSENVFSFSATEILYQQ